MSTLELLQLKRDKQMEVERSFSRKKSFARSRSRRQREGISKAIYGKSITVKLSTTLSASASTIGAIWLTVYPMVSTLQQSNDWANYSGGYQLYNLNKVKVQFIPASVQTGSTSVPTLYPVGMCYSTKDANALSNYNQLADHTNYTLFGLNNAIGTDKIFFKYRVRPKVKPPLSTADTQEAFGWLKTYSYPFAAGSAVIGTIIFTFTVTFSAEA